MPIRHYLVTVTNNPHRDLEVRQALSAATGGEAECRLARVDDSSWVKHAPRMSPPGARMRHYMLTVDIPDGVTDREAKATLAAQTGAHVPCRLRILPGGAGFVKWVPAPKVGVA